MNNTPQSHPDFSNPLPHTAGGSLALSMLCEPVFHKALVFNQLISSTLQKHSVFAPERAAA
ncbi:MAG TPA: hypothetical protein VK961_26655 [Chthoniobacter sp.]|nr:hypothetical protein [Chthoniobacter sp.]